MNSLARAGAHLRKAEEFLEAAQVTHELELFDAATSNAVTSGINSKDAVCLKLTGQTNKTDNHANAVNELRAAGKLAAGMTTALGRLLRLKNRSQYQAVSIAQADAAKAVEWAKRLYEAAKEIVNS